MEKFIKDTIDTPEISKKGEIINTLVQNSINKIDEKEELSQTLLEQAEIEKIRKNLMNNNSIEIKEEQNPIDLSNLEKMGDGGTHDVYSIPENDKLVIKINREIMKSLLEAHCYKLTGMNRNKAKLRIDQENKAFKDLYKQFGESNCLKENAFIRKVRTSDGQELETMVNIQEKSEIYKKPDLVDFNCYNLDQIVKKIEDDSDFKEKVGEFLGLLENYTNKTDNFIDLIGEKNVLFYQEDNKWQFKIGSVVKGDTKSDFIRAKKGFDQGNRLNCEQTNSLENGKKICSFINSVSNICLGKNIYEFNELKNTIKPVKTQVEITKIKNTEEDCGALCLEMLLQTDYQLSSDLKLLRQVVGKEKKEGTMPGNLCKALKESNYKVDYYTAIDWEKCSERPESEEKIARFPQEIIKNVNNPNGLLDYNKLKSSAKWLADNPEIIKSQTLSAENIAELLSQGKRVIALFGATHYVVITGIDENNIYFNNPALEPKQESLSHGDFFRRWREIFDSTEAIIATPQR